MIRLCLIVWICFFSIKIHAQFFENFSDGDLISNPSWNGDLEDFIVNDEEMLQLNAMEAGSSDLYVETDFGDSIEWNFYVNMDFALSGSNNSTIYLIMESSDFDSSDGYFLTMGETGSNDAINFVIRKDGQETVLARGIEGSLGASTVEYRAKIKRRNTGVWTFDMDYAGGFSFEEDIVVHDDQLVLQSGFFGIRCEYTSSRVDKFSFDDISVSDIIVDRTAPRLVRHTVTDNQVLLSFDEELDASQALLETNFEVSDGIGQPSSATFINGGRNELNLEFSNELVNGLQYSLALANIQDLFGNSLDTLVTFRPVGFPREGDLIVNEILFNPLTGQNDFVEIFNKSEKLLNINGIKIENTDNGQSELIKDDILMEPQSYVAFVEDKGILIGQYGNRGEPYIFESDLPAFNNDEGNVSIFNHENTLLDSFDFDEDFHFELLKDEDGVSLERISADVGSNVESNWTSAVAAVNFATPGYENSNAIRNVELMGEMFSLESRNFSPDADGFEDQLVLFYELDRADYLLNAVVFDMSGREIKTLEQNYLLGQKGFVTWNGLDNEEELASMGIYILWMELFSPDGDIIQEKLPFALVEDFR